MEVVVMQDMFVFINMKTILGLKLGNNIDGEAGGDKSGRSVSLSSDGTIVAIGAPIIMEREIMRDMFVFINMKTMWTKLDK